MSEPPLPSREAVLLGDRYRLVGRIGSGGTAVVWQARDQLLERNVAVKLLNPGIEERWWAAIRHEAKAIAQVASPHIAHMYDYGEWQRADGTTTPYLVMELIDGVPLSQRLAAGRGMPWREAATIVGEICQALAAAHARGLVHRDIKPDNIMLTGAGVKIIDFGIAATSGDRDDEADGTLVGTAAYVAPERLVGVPVGAPADIYAVGVLLYGALTGSLPWDVAGKTALMHSHLFAEPTEFPPRADDMPPSLAELCYACLDKDPNRRPTAAEMTARVAAIRNTDVAPPHRRRYRLAIVVGSAAAALVTIVALAAASEPHHPRTASLGATSTSSCTANLSIDRDWGTGFDATLTVTNTTTATSLGSLVSFTFPGNQQLVSAASQPAASQHGSTVVATATSRVPPRGRMIVPITADYRGANPLPTQFDLDRQPCATTITGAAYRPTAAPSPTPSGSSAESTPTVPTAPAIATQTAAVPTQPVGTIPTVLPTPTVPAPPPPVPSADPTTVAPTMSTPTPTCPGKSNPHGKCQDGPVGQSG